MHTAVLQSPRRLEIVERREPAADPGEVLVRVAATAVCHTDLEIYTGRHPGVRYPVVMGHEATGVIEALGGNVNGLQKGQPVLINPIIACGRCDMCARGAENLCRNGGLFGREVEGSMTQYARVAARYVHPLPEKLPLAAATLIETLATVRHAQQRIGIPAGEPVVVLGQGATGLLHTRLAVLAGARPVIAVSRSRWKLDMGQGMGAHHLIDKGVEDAADEVMRFTGQQGASVVIDTTGAAAALKAGADMLRPGGRLCAFAVSHVPVAGFSVFPLYYKEISIVGSRALLPEDMRPSIDLVASGAVDVKGFITAIYPLSDAAAAFEEYESNPGRILRIVIESGA